MAIHRRLKFPRLPFFRIFYSSTYTSLYIVELLLIAATPITLIYESFKQTAYQYIVIVGGVYVLTAAAVIFIYSSRLFTNRTVLAGVGKTWIPVEDGEVSSSVRKLIIGQLQRSALVALECRPRNLADASNLEDEDEHGQVGRLVKLDPTSPPWGLASHPGWSCPDPTRTSVSPNVFFMQVINELPNLLEAAVVSACGPPRTSVTIEFSRPGPLQSLRDYLKVLEASSMIVNPATAKDFISQYERARYSGRPPSESDFIALTASFASLLSHARTSGVSSNETYTNIGSSTPARSPIDVPIAAQHHARWASQSSDEYMHDYSPHAASTLQRTSSVICNDYLRPTPLPHLSSMRPGSSMRSITSSRFSSSS